MSHSFINSSSPIKTPVYGAKWMGPCVQPYFVQMGTASVLGATSKGVFLQYSTRQVVFLSGEVFRGPHTINLGQMLDFKASFTIGETCRIFEGQLGFTKCHILIGSDTHVWKPAPIQFDQGGMLQALQRGIDLAGLLLGGYWEGLFFAFLERLVEDPTRSNHRNLWALIPGMKGDGDLLEGLPGLIGLGRGLTPSGDDFICGFLLVDYYLSQIPDSHLLSEHFRKQLVASAQAKTTALSAALIGCAAQGQVDERILNALRWVAGGCEDINKISKELLSYGSSSGVDSFAGMLAAIIMQRA